jgi:hypothetical protein
MEDDQAHSAAEAPPYWLLGEEESEEEVAVAEPLAAAEPAPPAAGAAPPGWASMAPALPEDPAPVPADKRGMVTLGFAQPGSGRAAHPSDFLADLEVHARVPRRQPLDRQDRRKRIALWASLAVLAGALVLVVAYAMLSGRTPVPGAAGASPPPPSLSEPSGPGNPGGTIYTAPPPVTPGQAPAAAGAPAAPPAAPPPPPPPAPGAPQAVPAPTPAPHSARPGHGAASTRTHPAAGAPPVAPAPAPPAAAHNPASPKPAAAAKQTTGPLPSL